MLERQPEANQYKICLLRQISVALVVCKLEQSLKHRTMMNMLAQRTMMNMLASTVCTSKDEWTILHNFNRLIKQKSLKGVVLPCVYGYCELSLKIVHKVFTYLNYSHIRINI